MLTLVDDDRFQASAIRDLLHHARRADVVSLAGGLPAADALPVERLRRAADRVLTTDGVTAAQYGLTEGEPVLRELVADELGRHPDEVVVTSGSQQALDLLVAVCCRPGDLVAVEDPCYLGALQVLRARQVRPVGIPVDGDGLDVDRLEHLLDGGLRPRLLYCNPNFQNPTGVSLSPERALRLAELGQRYGFVVAADDPYRQLWLDARPVDLPAEPSVALLRSASKVIAPGLRVGWLVAEPELARRVAVAKQPADLQASTLSQLLVAEVLADRAWWHDHLAGLRHRYRARRDALLAELERVGCRPPIRPAGGFFCWLPAALDPEAGLPVALDAGVAYVPDAQFRVPDPDRRDGPTGRWAGDGQALRLSYSSADPATFGPAVDRLVAVGLLAPQATPRS